MDGPPSDCSLLSVLSCLASVCVCNYMDFVVVVFFFFLCVCNYMN